MFLEFYGLREQPFGVTADPRFLYLSAGHREALASLIYGIEAGLGFSALIAEPGMGKTTLLNRILSHFRSSARTAFIFETQCDSRQFRRNLLLELEITGFEDNEDDVAFLNRLKSYLLEQAKNRRRVLLMVDEAQNLDNTVLETIRLLSNFETYRSKLLHIILTGQPQLATKISRPEMVQLRQRINQANRLRPLPPEDTVKYIAHRLRLSGYSGESLFTPEALAGIVHWSRGVPREINRLCFNSMSLGCALQRREIDATIVQEVMADLVFDGELSALAELPQPEAGGFELAAQFRNALATPPHSLENNSALAVRQSAGTSHEHDTIHYARRRSFWRASAHTGASARSDQEEPTRRGAIPQPIRLLRPRERWFASFVSSKSPIENSAAANSSSTATQTTSATPLETGPRCYQWEQKTPTGIIGSLVILALVGFWLLFAPGQKGSVHVASSPVASAQSRLRTPSAATSLPAQTASGTKSDPRLQGVSTSTIQPKHSNQDLKAKTGTRY